MSIIKLESERTIARLREKRGSYTLIAKEIDVSPETLSKLARGEVKNPTIDTVDALHEYFFRADAECEEKESNEAA